LDTAQIIKSSFFNQDNQLGSIFKFKNVTQM